MNQLHDDTDRDDTERDLARIVSLAPPFADEHVSTQRLAHLRGLVDARRFDQPTTRCPASTEDQVTPADGGARSSWRRRGLLLGVAAAAAVVIPVAGGILAPVSPFGLAGTPAAVAEDGRLDCGTGFGEAVEPATVEPRYLPSQLPGSLSYVSVFARDNTARGWCVPPSLTALEVGPDDRVAGALKVYGPFDVRLDDSGMGTATDSTVAGHEARLFRQQDQESEGVQFYRWFFTDDTGQTWLAEVDGYPLEQAAAVVDGLVTERDHVTWSGTGPQLDIVHERTSAPYTLDSRHQSWDVNLSGDRRDYSLSVSQRLDNHDVPLFADATVGARLTSIDGRDVIQDPVDQDFQDGDGDGVDDGTTASVYMQLAPGVRAHVATATTEMSTELLISLELAPRGDPRIKEYGQL